MKKSAITINQKVLDQLAERNVVVNLTKRLPTVTIFVKEALPDLERVPRGLYLTEIYGGDIINGELNNAFLIFNLGKREVYWETTLIELLNELECGVVDLT